MQLCRRYVARLKMLNVTFLGTAGSLPTPDRNPSAVLVNREGEMMLFDCGEGTQRQMMRARTGMMRLNYIFLTHLHADHCGGCFVNAPGGGTAPLFPNASYHISRAQWEWANESNLREEDAFLPENIVPFGESGRLNLIEEPGELFPGVELRICYGHTPGLLVPVISYRGKKLIYTGDLIPTMAHIPLLWNMAYDLLPLVTIAEKQEILDEALRNDHLLVFQHDPHYECCSLTETPKGIRAGRKGCLTDFV